MIQSPADLAEAQSITTALLHEIDNLRLPEEAESDTVDTPLAPGDLHDEDYEYEYEEYEDFEDAEVLDDALQPQGPPDPTVSQYATTTVRQDRAPLQRMPQGDLHAQPVPWEASPPPLAPVTYEAPDGGAFAGSVGGWAASLALIFAIREGRLQAQADRLDTRKVQAKREQTRILDQKLLDAREAYALQDKANKTAEKRQALEEASKAAAIERKEQLARMKEYRKEQKKEQSRLEAERAKRREAYLVQEAKMAAELEAREAKERQLREEAAAARAAALEEQRAAEAAAAKAEAERKAAVAAEEKRAAEAAAAAKQAERDALRELSQVFAVRMVGDVTVSVPPKGALTEEAYPKPAQVQVEVSAGTTQGGSKSVVRRYAGVLEARQDVDELAGAAAQLGASGYVSFVRMQSMTNEGPLTMMDAVELSHWMACAATRVEGVVAAAATTALEGFKGANTPEGTSSAAFSLRTPREVLPLEHPERCDARLRRAASMVEEGRGEEASDAVLAEMVETESEALREGLPDDSPVPSHAGEVLVLSHFIRRMWEERPSKEIDAPAWFQSASQLVKARLDAATRSAPEDSLAPQAATLSRSLGAADGEEGAAYVARAFQRLAEGNLSASRRRQLAQQERKAEAERAARILEETWPDEDDIRAERAKEREAATPVPERVWALRNVSSQLASGGPGERARALKFLQQAVTLQQTWFDDQYHPGLLSELLALAQLCEQSGMRQAARPIWEQALQVGSRVSQAYAKQGQLLSAVLLAEGAIIEYEDLLPLNHPVINGMGAASERWFEALSPEDREAVKVARKKMRSTPDTMKRLAAMFCPQLGARAQGDPLGLQRWQAGEDLPPWAS